MPYFKKLKTESESKGRRGIILKFKKKGIRKFYKKIIKN